jgi:hypothetical protein
MNKIIILLLSASIFLATGCFGYGTDSRETVYTSPRYVIHDNDSRHFESHDFSRRTEHNEHNHR